MRRHKRGTQKPDKKPVCAWAPGPARRFDVSVELFSTLSRQSLLDRFLSVSRPRFATLKVKDPRRMIDMATAAPHLSFHLQLVTRPMFVQNDSTRIIYEVLKAGIDENIDSLV